jgi:hypothetical protein
MSHKCYVKDVEERLDCRRTASEDDHGWIAEVVYDYISVRGIFCDPDAPACEKWRWKRDKNKTLDNASIADMLRAYGKDVQPVCGNCYFCHEVNSNSPDTFTPWVDIDTKNAEPVNTITHPFDLTEPPVITTTTISGEDGDDYASLTADYTPRDEVKVKK